MQKSRCVLAGDRDRPSQRLCHVFLSLQLLQLCFYRLFCVIPGKTAGSVIIGPIQAKFLVIFMGAEAAPRPSPGFAASSHLGGKQKRGLRLNSPEGNFSNGFN